MEQSRLIAYRPDIDGMRAIAVLSVVLFHISKSFVPGGYVGVDLFFVISGYLITLHVYIQVLAGEFSFGEFYKRRINRIVPALFALIAGVSLTGLFVLSPFDLIRLFKSAFYASIGVSNIFFWREYGSYFSSGIDEASLLHTWSLGVEEQFYVLWPLALMVVVRLKPIHRYCGIGIALLAAVAVSEIGMRSAASASYYLLPTRAFELLTGGSLAVFFFHRQSPLALRAANAFGSMGLLLVAGCFVVINDKVSFPGVNAIYPCLGAAMLIAAGSNCESWTARALSVKPLVFFGLISYSLYLWHWPLIAFANYRGINIDGTTGATIFLLSVLLAWASWRFVETPFRRSGSGMSFSSVALRRYLAPVGIVIFAFIGTAQSGGIPGRFDPRVPEYERIITTAPNELRSSCHSPTFYYDRKPTPSCVLGVKGRAPEILLIGDSFANHFTGMVDILAQNDRVTVTDYTMDGCLPVKGMGFGAQRSYAQKCKARNDFSYEYISANKFKYVILAGSWPVEGTAGSFSALQAGLKSSIETIAAAGSKLIIIVNNEPTGNANCPVRQLLSGGSASCDRRQAHHEMRDKMFVDLKAAYPAISFIDPNQAICSGGVCHSMLGDIPLYRDDVHLNDVGSRAIGTLLVQEHVHLVDQGTFAAQHP
jgi:peptidoglycan/LPS O-acetylase OafA/YrhL